MSRPHTATPFLIFAFIGLATLQVLLVLLIFAPYCQKILITIYFFLSWARFLYLPLATFFLFIVLCGALFNLRAASFAKKGLFFRKGLLTGFLQKLTRRQKLDPFLAQQYHEATLDAGELSASLRAKIIGQAPVCEDIAYQLRRRLTLRTANRPIAAFLFAGPDGVGKTSLAREIARQIQRKFLSFDAMQISFPEHFKHFIEQLKTYPNAVVLLNAIETASLELLKKISASLTEGVIIAPETGEKISVKNMIFLLTISLPDTALANQRDETALQGHIKAETAKMLLAAGISEDITDHIDRSFLFKPLQGQDLARVAALEIEQIVKNYGLKIENKNTASGFLFEFLLEQQNILPIKTAKDLTRHVEDMLEESLILAKQSGASTIRLEQTPHGLRAISLLKR